MKKICLAIIYMSLSVGVSAQAVPKLLSMADELYQNDQYREAIEFYEKIVGLDKDNFLARFRLANCYQLTLDYAKAKREFLRLGSTPGHEYRARALYSYANLLKQDREFEVADSLYRFLIALPDAAPELIELSRKQREGCLLALRQQKADRGFSIAPLDGVNSQFHDFGAVINPSNDYLVLATTRKLSGTQYEGLQYEGLLPDLVAFEKRGRNRWRIASSDQNFSKLNSQWAEGSGSFTKDGKSFYFSSCRGENGADCGIMVSYLEEGAWTDPVFLNEYINEPGSENKHPSISASGDTLFFVSNRPGGVGGNDIWMSLQGLEKGSWSPAINMGAVINTPENDITPYYSSAYRCLIFASDGHVGYGGYDLFAAKGESFFEPQIYNLGDPFNSTWDDTYFNISDTVGFLATNREDHKTLNISYFNVSNERLFLALLLAGESLIDSRLASKLKDIQSLDLVTYRVEDYAGYNLFDPIKPKKPKPKILEDDNKEQAREEYAFERIFFDFASARLRPEGKKALESLMDQIKDKSIESINLLAYADSIGREKSNLKLSEERGRAVKAYLGELGMDTAKIKILPRGEIASAYDHWYLRIFDRRVEIVLKSSEPLSLQTATPFIVRVKISGEQLASALGVSKETFQEWNGSVDRVYEPGETIRIMQSEIKEIPKAILAGEGDVPIRKAEPSGEQQ